MTDDSFTLTPYEPPTMLLDRLEAEVSKAYEAFPDHDATDAALAKARRTLVMTDAVLDAQR